MLSIYSVQALIAWYITNRYKRGRHIDENFEYGKQTHGGRYGSQFRSVEHDWLKNEQQDCNRAIHIVCRLSAAW